ncbi:hypothetical protein B566_EDAN012663 [Ephemera danica]|nr:hypothetical protein B566_EDAN012663 [Ephemera danica]
MQVKGLAGPPTSPEQNTNIEDPEPEPPLSPRPKRKRVASPSPVPQHRQPVAAPPTPQPQQQQRTSLPNSPAVSITRLKQTPSAAQATPSTSRDTGSRAQSPGIEITPVVSFEEIKMEPIDISDSNDESMDPNMHCDDYDDEDLDDDSGDVGRGEDDTGGREGDPGPSLQPSSDDQPGTSKTTSNGPDLTTPGFSGNGIEIDDSAASYCAADLGLTTEPPEDPPDSGPGPSGL